MSRPIKTGLDYFPLDVSFFEDEKIEYVSARFDEKGELIAIKLLCAIYRNGYYTDWNEDKAALFSKRAGRNVSPSLANDVVLELVKRGFFERSIFNSFGILTSRGIQRRYVQGCFRRKEIEIIPEIWLIEAPEDKNLVNVDINSINVDINSINAYGNAQRKGKERKGKERKDTPPTPPQAVGAVAAFPPQLARSDPAPVPYAEIMALYNDICVSLPKIQIIDGNRRKAVAACYKAYGGIEAFRTLFEMAQSSGFLCGGGSKNWRADFDWLTVPTNMAKVLEGKYVNDKTTLPNRGHPQSENPFEQYSDPGWDEFRKRINNPGGGD